STPKSLGDADREEHDRLVTPQSTRNRQKHPCEFKALLSTFCIITKLFEHVKGIFDKDTAGTVLLCCKSNNRAV
ncbi:MAG: hypothetical protein LBD95_04040, partial [Clostridiales Family XIII bacterium]|nr:hypothetical protein [Clostridiales Family XIII bacterium]